jgi:hypothetical protein
LGVLPKDLIKGPRRETPGFVAPIDPENSDDSASDDASDEYGSEYGSYDTESDADDYGEES